VKLSHYPAHYRPRFCNSLPNNLELVLPSRVKSDKTLSEDSV
jgi:hypothetical protein